MNELDVFKALNNKTRIKIFKWLKEPEKHFPPQGIHLTEGEEFAGGVCVGVICDKAGITQSTVSHYLDILLRAGLLESKRYGKWTYYRRNEQKFQELSDYFRTEI